MKKAATIIAAMILAATMSMTAFAYGWGSDANGSFYYSNKDNTTKYTNGWYWVPYDDYGNSYSYYFDENGYILKDTTQDGFDLNSDGVWVINGVPMISQISLPYDYFDIQPSAEGLTNSSLEGTYYQYWENTHRYSQDPIIVMVVDEDTIIIQGAYEPYGKPQMEAQKISYNIYRYNPDPIYNALPYEDFVFRDDNTLEQYTVSHTKKRDESGHFTDEVKESMSAPYIFKRK